MSRRLRLCLLGAVLLGASACDLLACDREPPAPSGDLDRMGDAVLITPPGEGTERSFVVVTNPEIQQLRVFDVLEGAFVSAPNVFFPLSARTGPATRRLAVAPLTEDATTQRWLFAVDSAGSFVQVLDMTADVEVDEDTVAPRFTTHAVVETAPGPSDVAVWIPEEGPALLFVPLPEQGELQVLTVDLAADAPEGEEVARIDLGEGSVPARVAVDPTGDAVVVTDAALPSVAVVRVDTLEVDRRLEVGGPTDHIAIGRLDPGDGLAPLALVGLRDRPEVAALRLFRPGFREDRYEVLGTTGVPRPVTALYVPRQDRPNPRACCPLVTERSADDEGDPEAPTFAWGAVGTANGSLLYVRFDAPRGPGFDGDQPGTESLVRPIDLDSPDPRVLEELDSDQIYSGEGPENRRPSLAIEAVDNFGTPPAFPFMGSTQVDLVYEGSPPGAAERRAELVPADGGYALELTPGALPFEERDVRVGDAVEADTSGRGGSCPAQAFFEVAAVEGDTVFVSGVSAEEAACASAGAVTVTFFASGDFTVTTDEGYQGRVPLEPERTAFELPGFVLLLQSAPAGPPGRGSAFRVTLTQGLTPAIVELSRQSDFTAGGFGQSAALPVAIVGGPANVRLSEGEVIATTRMYVATGAGLLLEMEEATVNIDAIASFR